MEIDFVLTLAVHLQNQRTIFLMGKNPAENKNPLNKLFPPLLG